MANIQITQEIQNECVVRRGVKGSPAPIPQEARMDKMQRN